MISFSPSQKSLVNGSKKVGYHSLKFMNPTFNTVKVFKCWTFNKIDSNDIQQRAADKYSTNNDNGTFEQRESRERSGAVYMKKITPHEGAPGITVCMDHQHAKGGLGNQIDKFRVSNIEIFECCKKKYCDQNGAELIGVHHKVSERNPDLVFILQGGC